MNNPVETIDEARLIIDKYEWLRDKAFDLVDDSDLDEVTNLEFDENDKDTLIIYYSTFYMGYASFDSISVPIAWLFLSDDKLAEAKKERREAKKEAEQRQKELNEIAAKQEQERKERAEYERLKTKFESGGV